MAKIETDDITGTETTGHEWDGIKELNTPLPKWWLWTFYLTVAWSLVYVVLYPAIPLINDGTRGVLGYTNRTAVAEAISQAKSDQAKYLERIKTMSLTEIRADQELFQFAASGGRSAFAVNCSQCHGSGASGSKGYPNLNDDDWLWGGKLEDIYASINHGIRFDADENTRTSEMPAFGDGVLEPAQIKDVTEYVLALSGHDHDRAMAERGKTVYMDNCAACHLENGDGDREQGAPKLADAIWLYGDNKTTIAAQIAKPSHGVMPAWAGRLDDATIKQLAIFVHSRGGGE